MSFVFSGYQTPSHYCFFSYTAWLKTFVPYWDPGSFMKDNAGKFQCWSWKGFTVQYSLQINCNHQVGVLSIFGLTCLPGTIFKTLIYSYFEKGCRKNVHATIPKGNMGYDQYTVSDDCTCRTYFCCFPLALANTFPRPFVPILSNFFKEQWT